MDRQFTPEEVAERNSKSVTEVACLYYELSAVLECLDDAIDGVDLEEISDTDAINRAKSLCMAANRLTREVGRQVGAE